jgi:hypothetical protein
MSQPPQCFASFCKSMQASLPGQTLKPSVHMHVLGSHVHAVVQVSSLFVPHACTEPGLQPPVAMLHALQSLFHMPVLLLHVRVCTPQGLFGQGRVGEPVHVCPGQLVPQRQLLLQVCIPCAPHDRASPGAQSPSFEHAPQSV